MTNQGKPDGPNEPPEPREPGNTRITPEEVEETGQAIERPDERIKPGDEQPSRSGEGDPLNAPN